MESEIARKASAKAFRQWLSYSRLLIILAIVFFCGTLYSVATYGKLVYFLSFHRPFGLASLQHTSNGRSAAPLPTFSVQGSVSSQITSQGKLEIATLRIKPDTDVSGYLEVWAAGNHRELYKNPLGDQPTHFIANQTSTYTFTIPITSKFPKGIYEVSEIITSTTKQTDYDVHNSLASFTVM